MINTDLEWLKLYNRVFEDNRLKVIRKMPNGHALFCIWIHLLCEASQKNESGFIYFNDDIPYTPEILADVWDEDVKLVKQGLKLYSDFGMISIDEQSGYICVNSFQKWNDTDKIEMIRSQTRERVKRYREKKKKILLEKNGKKPLENGCNANVTEEVAVYNPDIQTVGNSVTECNNPVTESNATDKNKIRSDKNKIRSNLIISFVPKKIEKLSTFENISLSFWKLFKKILEDREITPTVLLKAKMSTWESSFRNMIKKEEVTMDQLRTIYVWLKEAKTDEARFWAKNIRSPDKLREKASDILLKISYEKEKAGGRFNFEQHKKNEDHFRDMEENGIDPF